MSRNNSNNNNSAGKEQVPLLSYGKNRRRAQLHRPSGNEPLLGQRVSSTTNNTNFNRHRDHELITDFDQVDSWGMLHESDTEYDLERNAMLRMEHNNNNNSNNNSNNNRIRNRNGKDDGLILSPTETTNSTNAFIDHRPSMARDNNNNSYLSSSNMITPKQKKINSITTNRKKDKTKKNKSKSKKKKNIFNNNTDDDVVIDVDALLQHVQKNSSNNVNSKPGAKRSPSDRDNLSYTAEEDEYDSPSSMPYSRSSPSSSSSDTSDYNSRPSLGSSSTNSSLDDVCLVIDDEDNISQKMWPDVAVLEEFSKEEIKRLRSQAIEDAEQFHFRYDETEEDEAESNNINNNTIINNINQTSMNQTMNNNKSGIYFSQPIVTNIDVPELGYKKVNEAEQLPSNGRLRPKKVSPWHLMQRPSNSKSTLTNGNFSKKLDNAALRDNLLVGRNIQYPPHIISNNPEHFRFAYFRMDLDSTVHSPTISGLLQPGQKFEDLFVSSVYAREDPIDKYVNSTKILSPSPPNISNHISVQPPQAGTTAGTTTATQQQQEQQQVHQMPPLQPNMTGATTTTNNTGITQQQAQLQNLLGKNASNISATTFNGAAQLNNNPLLPPEDIPPFWLDVVNPTEEEMKVLSKAFGIHPLTTEDIFLGEVREKVELFKDYYLICFRSFDIVAERHTRKKREKNEDNDSNDTVNNNGNNSSGNNNNSTSWIKSLFGKKRRRSSVFSSNTGYGTIEGTISMNRKRRQSMLKKKEEKEKFKRKSGDRHKPRAGELEPLNVYIIVFRSGVLTFHFAPTPHPINVRRRARLLKDYINVTADWIAYALIDDITDAFGPMIELIEDEVYDIEDAILKMNHSNDSSDSDSSSESGDSDSDNDGDSDSSTGSRYLYNRRTGREAFPRRSNVSSITSRSSYLSSSSSSRSSRSSDASTFNANIIGWKKKGDMLRRIGECRKRVMSILRLLGAKADVIKGFAKRYNGQWDPVPQAEIGMYLDDIQDHIITMVSSLNHYEKLLSRSHSNYLAQINIDMTKVNNDMNDVLGKITILGTIVLPMNVITGLWGMNVIVPGQSEQSLKWFFGILWCMLFMAYGGYVYTKRRFGF